VRDDLATNLEGLAVEVEEILLRREISRIEESGERLNRKTQKAIRAIATLEPEEDMLVVERLKPGFMIGDKVFRREEVVVKKFCGRDAEPSVSALERRALDLLGHE
jgi:molecular chaperone GrpE (heat shock protein)